MTDTPVSRRPRSRLLSNAALTDVLVLPSQAISDRGLVSPAWNSTRKHLSTLQEESEAFFDDDDDESEPPQPDVFLEAVLMPVENLQGIGDLSKTLVSATRTGMTRNYGKLTSSLRP